MAAVDMNVRGFFKGCFHHTKRLQPSEGVSPADGLQHEVGLPHTDDLQHKDALQHTNGLPHTDGLPHKDGLPHMDGLPHTVGLQHTDGLQHTEGLRSSVRAQRFQRWQRWSLQALAVLLLCVIVFSIWPVAGESASFAMGMLTVCALSGLLLMIRHPGQGNMTFLSLSDMLLTARVMAGSGAGIMIPGIVNFGEISLGMQMVFLLAGSLFFYLYALNVGRLHVSYAPLMNLLGIGICLIFILIFGFWPTLIAGPLYWAFVGGFVLSRLYLIGMTCQYWRQEKSWRAGLVLLQITLVTLVIFYDLLQVETTLPYIFLAYLYVLLLLFNMLVRLLAYHEIYQAVHPGSNLERIVAERTRQLTELNERLASLSERDALTGTYNRLRFDTLLDEMINRQKEEGFPLYLCIIDLDYFKKINDRFGHDQGDMTLKELAQMVTAMLPEKATLARLGGEEFVILIPDETPTGALALVEGIRKRLESLSHSPRRTTASFGLAAYRPNMTAKEFFKEADRCLFKAKAQGRNTVVTALDEGDKASPADGDAIDAGESRN